MDMFKGNDTSDRSTAAPITPGDGDEAAAIYLASVLTISRYTLDLGINIPLSLTGLVGNIVTIVVFAKIGYKETANITLTAIAFWDIFKSLFGFGGCFHILKLHPTHPDWYWTYSVLEAAVIAPVRETSMSVSSYLAAYVAIERCLCVTMPFTVKFMLTRKVVIINNVVISVVIATLKLLLLSGYPIQIVSIPIYNLRFLNYASTVRWINKYPYFLLSLALMHWLDKYIVFGIMGVCTIIIIVLLIRSSRFRSKNNNSGSGKTSSREKRTVKMLVVMIGVYMVYFVFVFVINLLTGLPKTFEVYALLMKFTSTVSLINASANIIIFYFMSSEFKRTLRKMFHMSAKTA